MTDTVKIDFHRALHVLWQDLTSGRTMEALRFIDELGRLLEMSFLGATDQINNEVGLAMKTRDDLAVLGDPAEFEDELRKLLGGGE